MKEAGFDISSTYETVLRNIYNANLLNCKASNISQVVNVENTSESEISAITAFAKEIDGSMDGNTRAFDKLITSAVTSSIIASHSKTYTNESLNEDSIEM